MNIENIKRKWNAISVHNKIKYANEFMYIACICVEELFVVNWAGDCFSVSCLVISRVEIDGKIIVIVSGPYQWAHRAVQSRLAQIQLSAGCLASNWLEFNQSAGISQHISL